MAYPLSVFLLMLAVFQAIIRIIRCHHRFPIPAFLTQLIDNPIRRRFIQLPEVVAVGRVLRLHNVFFKYPILVQPEKCIEWRKVQLVNWTQLIGTELGMTVRKNADSSIEIIAKVVEGRDPWKLMFRAREQADFLAVYLEQTFGMKLGRCSLSRKPHFGVYDPVARTYSRFFEFSNGKAKIDESEGYGEIDWLNPDAAADYLSMPSKIRKLEHDVNDIKEGMRLFSEGMLEHMKLIRELRGLVKVLGKIRDESRPQEH